MRTRVVTSAFGILWLSPVLAHAAQDFSSRTPLALAPGAPAGSYALSGFDSGNLYSGNLSVHLPLHEVVGRGDARYTMYLRLDRRFSIDSFPPGTPAGTPDFTGNCPPFRYNSL